MSTKAVGSSYLIRQSPGSERVGGLTITLTRPQGDVGVIRVQPTNYFGQTEITDDMDWMVSAARQGIQEWAEAHAFDLSKYDLTLSAFAYHPVDSHSKVFYIAAKGALQAAVQAWMMQEV